MKVKQQGISASKASKILGLSRTTVMNYINSNKIKATRIGKRWIVPITEIDRLLSK
jgi:excisionase family DNA binding protein